MAMQASVQTLLDGVRNCVMQFSGTCDGSGGETNEVKVRASDLNPSGSVQINIRRVDYSVNGGILRILWNSLDPQTFLDLEGNGFFDYEFSGGAKNPGVKIGDFGDDSANGDILFTTLGFDAGSNYSVKLRMKKS